jgi:hypothetical protein
MAFWLALDREDLELFQHIVSIDIHLRYQVILALKGKREKPPDFKISKKFRRKGTLGGGFDSESLTSPGSPPPKQLKRSKTKTDRDAAGKQVQHEGGSRDGLDLGEGLGNGDDIFEQPERGSQRLGLDSPGSQNEDMK